MSTRLSCFALISAIESDLRTYLKEALSASGVEEFLSLDMRGHAGDSRQRYIDSATKVHDSDFSLLDYLDFAHLRELIFAHTKPLPSASSETAVLAARGLESLIPIRNRVCHSRPL